MPKYHVKLNGEIGHCHAQQGRCPLTKEGAEHFESMENACTYSEALYEKNFGQFQVFQREESASGEPELEEVPRDPAFYRKTWGDGSYMGQNIERGEPITYDGDVYIANDWEWNRATLVTTVEATNLATGEREELRVPQDSEYRVSFLPKDEVRLAGGFARPDELQDYFREYEHQEEIPRFVDAVEEGKELKSYPTPEGGKLVTKEFSFGGQTVYANFDTTYDPDTYREKLESMEFFKEKWEALDRLERDSETYEYRR